METHLNPSDERLEFGHSERTEEDVNEAAQEIAEEIPEEMEMKRIEEILNEELCFYESNAINYFAGVIVRHVLRK